MSEQATPTDEQLERFVSVILAGEARRRGLNINAAWGARMAMRSPVLKEYWLERHRELNRAPSLLPNRRRSGRDP